MLFFFYIAAKGSHWLLKAAIYISGTHMISKGRAALSRSWCLVLSW